MRILDTKSFSVPGFKAWGIHCGIKKNEKKDLAIIYSDREAAVAGVFTKNRVKAACIHLNTSKVKSGKGRGHHSEQRLRQCLYRKTRTNRCARHGRDRGR